MNTLDHHSLIDVLVGWSQNRWMQHEAHLVLVVGTADGERRIQRVGRSMAQVNEWAVKQLISFLTTGRYHG